MTPSTGGLTTVLNACDSDLDWSSVTKHLDHDRPWVILLDDSQTDLAQQHIPTEPFLTIPADSIALWGHSFWEGKAGLFPETINSNIHALVSNAVTPQ
jgi:hypothetical protein